MFRPSKNDFAGIYTGYKPFLAMAHFAFTFGVIKAFNLSENYKDQIYSTKHSTNYANVICEQEKIDQFVQCNNYF